MEEDYEDYVWIASMEDEVLKERLLKEGFRKIPIKSIFPYLINVGITAYKIDEKKLPQKMKEIILERIAEKNNITIKEAKEMLDKSGWFVRAKAIGTKNIHKYID